MDEFALFIIVYIVGCFFTIVPPQELRSAGICVESIFSSYLGSENQNLVLYHMKRTALNHLVHSCLPIGFYLTGVLATSYFHTHLTEASVRRFWMVYIVASAAILLAGAVRFVMWTRCNFRGHPFATTLAAHATDRGTSENRPADWRTVAASVNAEFRAFDKFSSGAWNCRVHVTTNWIIKTSIYSCHLVHKSDTHLALTAKQQLAFTVESQFQEEYITIDVHSINHAVAPFEIRLKSQELTELRDRLSMPIVNARNIVLSQSINERFTQAFRECVDDNRRFVTLSPTGERRPTLVDTCIGCGLGPSDVKLQKQCQVDGCGNCFCRPMWCLVCLGRWFAARQDQSTPQVWLQGTAPCPTCRAKFCVLDVAHIDSPLHSGSDD